MIGTTLLEFKSVSNISTKSKKTYLYTYFTNYQDKNQVILLYNTKDDPAIEFTSTGINVITSTKFLEECRYDFLIKVTYQATGIKYESVAIY